MSLDILKGYRATRKTEVENLIYVFIYLFKSEVKVKTYLEKINKIKQIHLKITDDELCKGIQCQIFLILSHIRVLEYDEKANYNLYLQLLKD